MSRGYSKLVAQRNKIGYYAEVTLELTKVDSHNNLVIEFDKYAQDWKLGVQFGLETFWEYLAKKRYNIKGLEVKVLEKNGHIEDTGLITVAYVTIKAALDALGITDYLYPAFDENTGLFCFTKWGI